MSCVSSARLAHLRAFAAIRVFVKDKKAASAFRAMGQRPPSSANMPSNGIMMRAVGDTMIMSPPLIWTKETIEWRPSAICPKRSTLGKAIAGNSRNQEPCRTLLDAEGR